MNRKTEKSNQQINTFLRWLNAILKRIGLSIENLRSDLSDGVVLITLVEYLSGHFFPKYNKQPTHQDKKIENVSLITNFLKNQNVLLNEDIDPVRIVEGKIDAILYVIWSLILHYSISLSTFEYEDGISVNRSFESSKDRLLQWIQNRIPRLSISNFTNDWTNGIAIGALVNAVAPGICPDWDSWNVNNSESNTKEAMSQAHQWLDVENLVTPDELIKCQIDERSMMVYLSQFPTAKLKSGAPLRSKRNSDRVIAYGPGIELFGPIVGSPANFTVETLAAGKGSVDVNIRHPNGAMEKADVRFNNDKNLSYSVSYVPKVAGVYKIYVTFLGKDIPNSPFEVNISEKAGDSTKVSSFGPGLQSDNVYCGHPTYFDISTKCAGSGTPEVVILDPAGHKTSVPVKLRQIEQELWRCEYTSSLCGLHSVNVFFAGEPIKNSPFGVKVLPVSDPRKIRVRGRGIQARGIRSGDDALFFVYTEGAGLGTPDIKVIGPNGINQNFSIKQVGPHKYECHYYPVKEGKYIVMVKFNNVEIPKSPFEITIGPKKQSSIIAHGPGLYEGVVGYAAAFVVEMNGETGSLGFSVAGPSQAEIDCHDNGDGSALVKYYPTIAGEYAVHILCDNDDIPSSPYISIISPKSNFFPDRVKCYGLGNEPNGAVLGQSSEFAVDTSDAGIASLDVKVQDAFGELVPITINKRKDYLFNCSYIPQSPLPHTVQLSYGGVAAAGSPYRVYVNIPPDVTKMNIFGDWFELNVEQNLVTCFNVNARDCGDGDLEVEVIHKETEAKIPVKMINNDNIYTIELVPLKPGIYRTKLFYAGIEVPFDKTVYVFPVVDLSKIQISGLTPNSTVIGRSNEFTIDMGKTGAKVETNKLSVSIIDPHGRTVPNKLVQSNTSDVYKVVYAPHEIGRHVIQVTYDKTPIPGSPFIVNMSSFCSPSRCKATGIGLESGICGETCKFVIDTREAGVGGLTLAVEGPAETKLKCTDNKNGSCDVEYIPTEPGEYDISILFANTHIPGSPFKIQIKQPVCPEKVKVFGPAIENELKAGEATYFNIDVSEAGPGLVGVALTNMQGHPVDNVKIESKGNGLYLVHFIPPAETPIILSVKFAHQDVCSSPFILNVTQSENVKPEEKKEQNLKFIIEQIKGGKDANETESTNQKNKISKATSIDNNRSTINKSNEKYGTMNFNKIPFPNIGGTISAEIKMPSGKVDLPLIEDNRDGTVRVQYDPKEEGIHELTILYNGVPVEGSPYKFHVDSISSGTVTAYGPGLTTGKSGESCNFTISTKGAGAGGLSLAVEGPSKAKISYNDNKDGTVSVTFLPTEPGEYNINVRFGDRHIKGSPFVCQISGGKKRNQISIGSCSEVTLPGLISDADLRSLNAIIQTPIGLEEPCFLKRLPSGNIGISFTPREPGEHTVSVKRLGKQIKNSPFKIKVAENDVGDASKVKVTGDTVKEGKTQTDNAFVIDTRKAGYGGLSMSIEGPSKADIKCQDSVDGTLQVSYKPTEPGDYSLNLKFADHHVSGSPFNIKVTGEGVNRQREKFQQQTSAVPSTEVGSKCKLTFKMPGITSFDLTASVTSPSGVCQDAEVKEIEDGVYAVHFVPKEQGIHTVSVKYTELHIPGSPFQFTVGPFGDSGSHLVKAGGQGLQLGEVGVPAEFNVWTREAGGGSLAISVEGPSKAEISFKDRKDGACNVSYVVKEPGEYYVGIKFNDSHIPDSPFKVHISPAVGDAHKLEVAQFPQGTVQKNTPSQFLVRKNGAKGELDAKIIAPSNTEDDCFIQAIDQDEYSIRFYPREEGIHIIHCKFNGIHIPGSPFLVKVGKDVADPAIVSAQGPGLKDVVTGQKTHFILNTCDAGIGTLSVSIDGPSRVSMDCTEIDDGYKVRYTPLLPGEHFATVKYNGVHIVGSPFKINCTGKKLVDEGAQETSNVTIETTAKVSKGKQRSGPVLPVFNADPSKVTTKGMGLKKAFLGKQNQFTVNASEAGHSILFVGLYNPKGPCEEVQVKHTGKHNYTVNYYIRERGEYTLIVMWGDHHIPGSPFAVEVPVR